VELGTAIEGIDFCGVRESEDTRQAAAAGAGPTGKKEAINVQQLPPGAGRSPRTRVLFRKRQ
jgi:hypothetical protein